MLNKNYKIALVYPPLCERFSYYRFGPRITIMGQGYLHSYLDENGIQAEQVNLDNLLHTHTEYWKEFDKLGTLTDDKKIELYLEGELESPEYDRVYEFLINCCDWTQYDMLAISYEVSYLRDIYAPAYYRFLKTISESYNITLTVGGLGFASFDIVKYIKRFSFIDYVSFGRIDSINLNSFLAIVNYERGEKVNLEEIKNICYREESGRVKANFSQESPKASIERDFILKPLYKLNEYKGFRTKYSDFCSIDSGLPENFFDDELEIPIIPYRFTINCINKCAFCMCSADGHPFSFKPPEQVADDFERLIQENESNYFMFLNAMINFSKPYLAKLLNQMQKRNIKLYFTDSAEVFGMDEEMLQIIKEMGGVALWYGLECPSNRLLKYINKRCTVEDAERVLEFGDKLGIWNGVNLISGLPHERDEDVDMTVDFIKKNINVVDMWQVTPFYLVRSQFLENPEKYGIKVKNREVVVDKGEGDLIMASFDEIGGLNWDEKTEKTTRTFKLFLETIDRNATVPNLSNMGLLFYIYTKFNNNKTEVKKWLTENYKGYAPKIKITGLKEQE